MQLRSFVLLLLSLSIASCTNWRMQKLSFLFSESDSNLSSEEQQLKQQLQSIKSMLNSKMYLQLQNLGRQVDQPFIAKDNNELCDACQSLMGKVDKLPENQKVFDFLANIFGYICRYVTDADICAGVTNEYGVILIESLLKKVAEPKQFCSLHSFCSQYKVQELEISQYAQRVLKDKPSVVNNKQLNSINNKQLNSNITGNYTILHLTDTHIDLLYKEGYNTNCSQPFCCRKENGSPTNKQSTSGKWGSVAKCDLPIATVDQALQQMAQEVQPDMIIWTGDSQNHDVWNQNLLNQTHPQQLITSLVQKHFNNTPMFPIFGNHECYPADAYDFHSNYSLVLNTQSAHMWQPYLTTASQQSLIHHGYYSQTHPSLNLKLVALNTQACDNINFFLIANNTDPGNQLQWLEQQLNASEAIGQQVILFGHIPPGDTFCSSRWSRRYNILIERYSSTVTAQIFGHTHYDHIELQRGFYDSSQVTGVVHISPSMTTYDYRLPSMRVYTLDKSTNQLLDYDQYRLDLNKANSLNTSTIHFDLAYSFKHFYSLPSLETHVLAQFVDNLEYDDHLLQQYIFNYYAGGPLANNPIKNIQSLDIRKYFICQAKYAIYDDALACLGKSIKDYKSDLIFRVFEKIQGKWLTLQKVSP